MLLKYTKITVSEALRLTNIVFFVCKFYHFANSQGSPYANNPQAYSEISFINSFEFYGKGRVQLKLCFRIANLLSR